MDVPSTRLNLAAATLAGLSQLGSKTGIHNELSTKASYKSVVAALNEFDACTRYLNTRRSAGAVIDIQSEADVQDVLYLLLRPWVVDLVYESPADKSGNRYAIKDF